MKELMCSTSLFGLLAGYKLRGHGTSVVIDNWYGADAVIMTVCTTSGKVSNVVASDGRHVDWHVY